MSGYAIFGTAGGGGGQTPTVVKADETYTVQEDKQELFIKRIFVEDGGRIVLGGILVQAR